MIPPEESRRLKNLHAALVTSIPRIPNNRDTLKLLQGTPLPTLMVYYVNHASRQVAIRPRRIQIEPSVTADPRWRALRPIIDNLLAKARAGLDLTPHLSFRDRARGFAPQATSSGDKWADKDFLLNIMGLHHFHLGEQLERRGHVKRTEEVLFARVDRDMFCAVAIADHSAFESIDPETGGNSPTKAALA